MSKFMQAQDKIYVAGHRGLVGSALVRQLEKQGYANVVTRTRAQLDLTDTAAVRDFFREEKPAFVFLAAAKVGGILANNSFPAEFIYQNLSIQNNIIQAAYEAAVKRLLFLGSSCIYPKLAPQPIKEEYLLTGPLEETNRAYALAKIAGIEMCSAYNRQYGTRYLAAMPTNLYGPGDNYDLQNSHVLPALIRKFHEAKMTGAPDVVVWGTGTPRREFLFSDDLAEAGVYLLNCDEAAYSDVLGKGTEFPLVNIGVGEDLSIADLASLVKDVIGYAGRLVFDTSKPDGTPRKLLDISHMHAIGWSAKTSLREGIKLAYADFTTRLDISHHAG